MKTHQTMRTLLIDDSPGVIDLLRKYLGQCCPEVAIISDAGSVKEARELIDEHKPDFLFLDIILKGGTGFDLLKQLEGRTPYVIFITGHGSKENTLRALQYSAIDFIDKPFSTERIREAVERASERLNKQEQFQQQLELMFNRLQQNSHQIAVPLGDGDIRLVEVDRVKWIESDGQVSHFHLAGGEIVNARRNIGYFDKILTPDYPFFRIHSQILVNTDYVERFTRTDRLVHLHSGETLEASRRLAPLFREHLLGERRTTPRDILEKLFDLFR